MSPKADLGCYLGKVGAGQAEKHRRRRRVEITLVLWGVEDLSDTRGCTKELWD